jgi:UDP-N-acetylglucosamine 4,6-dehydratase/5-epimerase
MNKRKVLFITGGTGSFGNAVLRRFLHHEEISEIRIYSRDEKKQDDMRRFYDNPKIKYYIGDVRNELSLEIAMKGADMVFHAAALKQVPSCEFFPMEAVMTNVVGTQNVLNAAYRNQVKNTIVLSTDKAVYPINAMGISKAMGEKVMISFSRNCSQNGSVMCGTRYGNVMASRGSVIPLFIKQLKAGAPLTITDPEMTRFMMSIDSAVDLVLFAFENGRNGDIFVQKAPACSIQILVNALLELYNSTSEIRIIGTRHGEKKYESLLTREEMAKAEDMGNYFRIPADNRDLNYGKFFSEGKESLNLLDDYTSDNTKQLAVDEAKDLLMTLPQIRADLLNENISHLFEP